jgi:hypothetical protein
LKENLETSWNTDAKESKFYQWRRGSSIESHCPAYLGYKYVLIRHSKFFPFTCAPVISFNSIFIYLTKQQVYLPYIRFHQKKASVMFEKLFGSFKGHRAEKKRKRAEIRTTLETLQSDVKRFQEMVEATEKLCQMTPNERREMIYDNKYPRVILDYWNVPKELTSVEGIRYMATDLLNQGPIYKLWTELGFNVDGVAMKECIDECDVAPESKRH